ncbi:type II toxin-antitoxin system prevent-host-death family antitoxin [Pseudothauera rhizosphaerae]|uniref:Type II toxin-antitoxin system prevent-host-death family antitoxin n=1 Tax=Pseudothauera rhizosphaerae TaxID=2565932 RepID=A0A4S4AXV4_9RHOO|nr:type II toxin-antitoxin system prevent-host-death family antitoxin [Pseudothauera rhizosphaerae]THF63432.1 type II toxin-antitoxin system prevent-host-death family antitoxin [Pseudothauera rhizosphaerae]
MAQTLRIDALDTLPRTPAADVKKHGWRGVMKTVGSKGKVLVTNHNEPEAVILSTAEYTAMVQALTEAQTASASALETLRRRFDQRLAALRADDAGERLRALIRQPATLGGKVKAGTGH